MYSSEERGGSRRRRTASFSSSLLDAVYRSIDDSKSVDDLHHHHHEQQHRRREEQSQGKTTLAKKMQIKNDNNSNNNGKLDRELENLRRAMMIESWVKKLNSGSAQSSSTVSTSASSSSESLWSSSETDSRPKPERQRQRVVFSEPEKQRDQDNPKPCYGFSRTTKLKAMKIYGELKKVKQPISPGGRIATFLNSFFSSGNVKKAKMCYVGAVEDVTVASDPPPPSSSSRSCLVKPQASSRSEKRSVRFYPLSVVLGEDEDESETTRDRRLGMSNFAKKKMNIGSGPSGRFCNDRHLEAEDNDDEDEDDDDDESCSSSDLFEIDHLGVGVGVGLRYSEELPVFETTSLKTNHAIAHGLIY